MLYVIAKQGDEHLLTISADEPPTLDRMAECVAQAYGYQSVDALAQDNPDLWLGWFHLH